ncbi:hypothetical protein G6F35_018809 [Rhizopus arrhizus]|nr:hypothetical protein G6F35_018809 [Rhizopus arrhizus]
MPAPVKGAPPRPAPMRAANAVPGHGRDSGRSNTTWRRHGPSPPPQPKPALPVRVRCRWPGVCPVPRPIGQRG